MRRRSPVAASRDRGAVTAELAVGLVAAVLVLAALLGVGVVAHAQLRCTDAARAGARAAARGDSTAEVTAVARRLAGDGARASTSREGELVRVDVSTRVTVPVPGAGALTVSATAVASAEQDAGGAG